MSTSGPTFHNDTQFGCRDCKNYKPWGTHPQCVHWTWCMMNEYHLYKVSLKARIKSFICKYFGGK